MIYGVNIIMSVSTYGIQDARSTCMVEAHRHSESGKDRHDQSFSGCRHTASDCRGPTADLPGHHVQSKTPFLLVQTFKHQLQTWYVYT